MGEYGEGGKVKRLNAGNDKLNWSLESPTQEQLLLYIASKFVNSLLTIES